MSPKALRALKQARRDRPAIGDVWVFSSPEDVTQPCSRHLCGAQRRKFATDMKHVPLVDLCYLGGWKDPQTVLKCYQRPDERTVREALASRGRRLAGAG